MIPQHTLDEILEKVSIVEVVQQYPVVGELVQKGRHYTGLCPFHDDSRPSLMVNPEKGLYKCFACGSGGNAFRFVMEIEGLSFPHAVEKIAGLAGIEVAGVAAGERHHYIRKQEMYKANQLAVAVFQENLKHAEHALAYLQGRGFTPEDIEYYSIGYARDSWDGLERDLGGDVDADVLVEAGLSVRKERQYDFFRDRVMLPVQDEFGRVAGFVGRSLGKQEPKYLNSPESAVYHKREVLFGLHLAGKSIRKKGEVVIVEGYLDQIALHRHGVEHVVALGGVVFSDAHAFLLQQYAEHAFVCLDMDAAGVRKTFDVASTLSRAGLEVGIVSLPEQMDPDDYLKVHSDIGFLELLEQAQTPLDFKLGRLEYDVKEKKYRALKAVMPLLSAIADPVRRWVAVDSLEEKIGLPVPHIVHALQEYSSKKKFLAADLPFLTSATGWQECEIIGMYLRWPGLREVIRKKIPLELFSNPLVREIARWLYNQVHGNQMIADAVGRTSNHQRELFEGYALSGLVRAVASEVQTDTDGLLRLLARMLQSKRSQTAGVREIQGLRDILMHHAQGKQIVEVQEKVFAAELRRHPGEVAALLDALIVLTKDYK